MRTEETYQVTDSPTEIGDLTYPLSSKQKKVSCATHGSLSRNKNQTSTDSASSCLKNTRTRKSSETSHPASTSKEKVFVPYWNELCEEKISQWLSPTGIDSLVSASTSLSGSSVDQVGLSWSSIKSAPLRWKNSPETSLRSLLSSHPVSTDSEVTRSRKILLRPSTRQKELLRQWFGAYRWAFNQTVTYKDEEYQELGKSGRYMKCRKEWKAKMLAAAPWIADIPAHIIYGAMMDAEKAYTAMIRVRKSGAVSKLPRCRKKMQRSCYILGNAVTSKGIYPRKLGLLKSAEPLPHKPSDSRLMLECGRWYLSVPQKVAVQQSDSQGFVACDPGVRTFITAITQTGAIKIGDGAFGRIVRLAQHLDNLLSRASQSPCRRKQKMRKAAARARRKIKRLVDDLHYQTIGWLLRNHNTVIFPEGDFTSACARVKRKIGSRSVRSLLTWAFARFKRRLIHKAQVVGRNVIVIDEAYTSKTANWTGEIVHNLGGRCSITSSGVKLDRDVNAALGILLKPLVDHPVAVYRNCNC